MRTNVYGFTLVELLIVIAISGILLTLGVGQLRPPEARLFANGLKSQIVQARIEAIKRNRPVAVLWNPTAASFTTLVMQDENSTALPCASSSATITVATRLVSEYRNVTASSVFTSSGSTPALVWFPNGFPRFCNNNVVPAANTTVRVSDQRTTLFVRVAPAGRVELANAP